MFIYKTQSDIDKMSDTELDAYNVAKREFETNATKEQIETALKAVEEKNSTEFKEIKKTLDALKEEFNQLSEKTENENPVKKGSFVEFVEKNIEKFSNDDKQYGSNTVIKVAALMTTANVLPNVAGGFNPLFGNYIDTEIGNAPKPENVVLPLVTVTNQPGTENIWYTDRINEDGDAEFIGEGTLKPLADADYQAVKTPVKEVAVRWKFTKRLMMHAPSVVSDFLTHANELVEQKIDDNMITGDGLTVEPKGLQAAASAFVVPAGLANYYSDANIFDVINAVATQVRLANFKGQLTAILNTVWMAKMQGVKNLQGDYIVPPFVTPDGRQVGEVRIVFSNKVADTDIILGDLKKFNVVFAEDIMYDEGYENDDFSKNLVSRKLEAFLGTYIKASDAGAIIYDQIASIITDIEEVPVP